MSTKIPIRYGLLLALLFASANLCATGTAAADDLQPSRLATADLPLEELELRAGIIFAGKVVKIEVPEGAGPGQLADNACCVQITFRVDDGIRNANSGELITIREWAGLWRSGAGQRYRVGEKLLMFFHLPNASGTTSPVGGAAGRLTIAPREQIRLTPERKQSLFRSARLRGFEQDFTLHASDTAKSVPYTSIARALRLIVAEAK